MTTNNLATLMKAIEAPEGEEIDGAELFDVCPRYASGNCKIYDPKNERQCLRGICIPEINEYMDFFEELERIKPEDLETK